MTDTFTELELNGPARSSKGPSSTLNSADATLLPPASVTVAVIVRSAPRGIGFGVARTLVVIGGEISIFTTTETEFVSGVGVLPLVAEQVSVVPVVGAVKVVGPQPVLEAMLVSGSVTLQVTVTGRVLFQSEPLGRGLTVGIITGGVVSAPGSVTVSVMGWLTKRVFPAASARKTEAVVQVPASVPTGKFAVNEPL